MHLKQHTNSPYSRQHPFWGAKITERPLPPAPTPIKKSKNIPKLMKLVKRPKKICQKSLKS
jgi:hypothetical protein